MLDKVMAEIEELREQNKDSEGKDPTAVWMTLEEYNEYKEDIELILKSNKD